MTYSDLKTLLEGMTPERGRLWALASMGDPGRTLS